MVKGTTLYITVATELTTPLLLLRCPVVGGGGGADEFTFTDNSFGKSYVDGNNAKLTNTIFTTIADFERGTDKISLYSLYTTGFSPTFTTENLDDVSSNNVIAWNTSGGDMQIAIIGDSDEYLFLSLTGVTTLALTDFEIL